MGADMSGIFALLVVGTFAVADLYFNINFQYVILYYVVVITLQIGRLGKAMIDLCNLLKKMNASSAKLEELRERYKKKFKA